MQHSVPYEDNPESVFASIPEELVRHIVGFLDYTTLALITGVSKLWSERANDPLVWKILCAQDFGVPFDLLGPGNVEENWKHIFFHINDEIPHAFSATKPLADGLTVDGLTITYRGVPGADQVVFGNMPLVPRHDPYPIVRAIKCVDVNNRFLYNVSKCDFGYYEVTILPVDETKLTGARRWKARLACVAVGLAHEKFPHSRYQPGWRNGSYGFHSDDGNFFHNGMSLKFNAPFAAGDTIGCGWNPKDKCIFYTKNGKNLGIACTGIPDHDLFPVIGIDTEHILRVNFGAEPFKYDINSASSVMDDSNAFKYVSGNDSEEETVGTGFFNTLLQGAQALLAHGEGLVHIMNDDDDDFSFESSDEESDLSDSDEEHMEDPNRADDASSSEGENDSDDSSSSNGMSM